MNNTVESVKQLIRNAVETSSGWTTVFGPAQGPEPANQYCLLTLMGIEKEQYEVSKWENAWTERQRCESTLEFEIQARGKTAMATLEKVMAYFDSEVRDLDLWSYVGSGGHDDIQNAAVYHEGKILEVAIVKLYIHTTLPKENTSEFFDILDISVNRSDNMHVATLTVPPRDQNEGE